jgi:hypothetical protein
VTLIAEWEDVLYSRKDTAEYVVFHTREGYRVDWEASLGYNATKLSVFVAKREAETVACRVTCALDSYHNYEYRDTKSSHYSLRLKADKTWIHGYVVRDSPTGERIARLLGDGEPHALMLELCHIGPYGESLKESDSHGSVVAITDLISESWVLPD